LNFFHDIFYNFILIIIAYIMIFFYYSLLAEGDQEIVCDIYSSRIKAPEGENKYELVAAYLQKAVAAKKNSAPMDKMLHFGGHGYNSESMQARVDEAGAHRVAVLGGDHIETAGDLVQCRGVHYLLLSLSARWISRLESRLAISSRLS
jgi:hypothetical protein